MVRVELLNRVKLKGAWYAAGTVLEVDGATCDRLTGRGCAQEIPEPAVELPDEDAEDLNPSQPEGGQGREEGSPDPEGADGTQGDPSTGPGERDPADTEEEDTEGAEGDPLADLAAEAAAAAAEGTGEAPKGEAAGSNRRARKGGAKASKE